MDEINKVKLGEDNKNHNKLRFYSTVKGCFKKEPYLDLVPNRAQRADLTRFRISSSRLAIEVQRYKRPKVPEIERYCMYCRPTGPDNNIEGYIDNEEHFLTGCSTFTLERNCLFTRMESLSGGFGSLSSAQQSVLPLRVRKRVQPSSEPFTVSVNLPHLCGAFRPNLDLKLSHKCLPKNLCRPNYIRIQTLI